MAAALAVVAALAAVALPVVSSMRDDATAERARAERRQAALEAAERARLTRDVRPVRAQARRRPAGADRLAHRAALVARGEQLILADARGRVAAGSLEGDIRGVSCTPYPTTEPRRSAEASPATRTGRYECVAYTSSFAAPEGQEGEPRTGFFGYPYWLVIEYDAGELVWCKVTPGAGEGARSLAVVPVPEPCRDPAGPG